MRVEFFRSDLRRFYRSLFHRPDGLQVEFQGGGYNKVGGPDRVVPHDFAHLVVEQELGLRNGVWGVLEAGGMFGHARVVAGRRAPHASRKGRRVIDEAGDEILQAEILTRVVCDVAAGVQPPDLPRLRREVGERWWSDAVTREALDRSRDRLRDGAAAWARLGPGEPLVAEWVAPRPVKSS